MSEYIERDAVKDMLKRECSPRVMAYLVDELCEIPAADVRPVVRGKWTGNARHQSCSECHMTYCVPDGLDGELDMTAYHYCPNCGAKMEES